MNEETEPAITLEMLQERQARIREALDACLRNLHAKYGIASSEALAGLAAVAHAIAVRQTMMYWEIPTPDDVP